MDSSLSNSLINIKSPYLKTLANSFESNTQGNFNMQQAAVAKENSLPIIPAQEKKPAQSSSSSKFAYYSGLLAAAGQAAAGLMLIPSVLLMKRVPKELEKEAEKLTGNAKEDFIIKNGKSYVKSLSDWALKKKGFVETIGKKLKKYGEEDKYHKIGSNINNYGWKTLSASWLISVPSCIGAALNAKQPSMIVGSLIWGIAAPFMLNKANHNTPAIIGSTPLGAAFVYAGLSNKEHNDNELKKGEKPREFNFKEINLHNFFKKSGEFANYVIKDLAALPAAGSKAVSQSWNYITGKRKDPPEYWTVKPTDNNSKLASLLLLPSAIFFMAFGRNKSKLKEHAKLETLGNVLIGIGLSFEALYMFTLGNAQKGVNKALILAGVPMRIVGDFGQSNPVMHGMRTLGGASFEYYFATLNDEQEKKKSEAALKIKTSV